MRLSPSQIDDYQRDGYLLLPAALPRAAVDRLNSALLRLFDRPGPQRVLEVDGETVRSVYGCHFDDELFWNLTCHPALLAPAAQLLDCDVYVYQLKVNAKRARTGDRWDWHQDLIYWREEDGLPGDRILNVALFLDDAGDDNGVMQVIPGSHRAGVIESAPTDAERAQPYRDSPPWIVDLIAAIKYRVGEPTLSRLISERGVTSLAAPAGSVLLFHPNLVHASPPNPSARDRKLLVATYNDTRNQPRLTGRPDFLVSRDFRALREVADARLD
jgi:ectoine hydroxylase